METSKIKTISFKNEYNPPKGDILYVHSVSFENGHNGLAYFKEKMPERFKEGVECTYLINGDKIKELKPVQMEEEKNQSGYKYQNSMAGFCISYAKDVVVSRITAKEKGIDAMAEIKKLSTEMYEHYKYLSSL